jgi:hypothetical protein
VRRKGEEERGNGVPLDRNVRVWFFWFETHCSSPRSELAFHYGALHGAAQKTWVTGCSHHWRYAIS